MKPNENITLLNAYKSMFLYLEKLYNIEKSDEIAKYLSGMQLICGDINEECAQEDVTVDPLAWIDYLRCVEEVVSENKFESQ